MVHCCLLRHIVLESGFAYLTKFLLINPGLKNNQEVTNRAVPQIIPERFNIIGGVLFHCPYTCAQSQEHKTNRLSITQH